MQGSLPWNARMQYTSPSAKVKHQEMKKTLHRFSRNHDSICKKKLFSNMPDDCLVRLVHSNTKKQKNRTTISRTTQVISATNKCEKSGLVVEEQ